MKRLLGQCTSIGAHDDFLAQPGSDAQEDQASFHIRHDYASRHEAGGHSAWDDQLSEAAWQAPAAQTRPSHASTYPQLASLQLSTPGSHCTQEAVTRSRVQLDDRGHPGQGPATGSIFGLTPSIDAQAGQQVTQARPGPIAPAPLDDSTSDAVDAQEVDQETDPHGVSAASAQQTLPETNASDAQGLPLSCAANATADSAGDGQQTDDRVHGQWQQAWDYNWSCWYYYNEALQVRVAIISTVSLCPLALLVSLLSSLKPS